MRALTPTRVNAKYEQVSSWCGTSLKLVPFSPRSCRAEDDRNDEPVQEKNVCARRGGFRRTVVIS